MGKRKQFAIAAALAGAAAISLPASAHTSVGVQIGLPVYVQPAPVVVYERASPARVGERGHWEWQGNGHVWVPAHYVVRPRYRPYAVRDSDHDGVPNRWDRAPGNPWRY